MPSPSRKRRSSRARCDLIAIGASAGGLPALLKIVSSLAPGGPAVLIVQHLDPRHKSQIPQLLGRAQVDFVLPSENIGPKLLELTATEELEKVRTMPTNGERNMPATGQTYSCPECGGVLEEAREGGMLRFRCRVGHLYSPESLLADQTLSVEKALWAAIRSMEEQAEFSERLANNSRQRKRPHLARRFDEKAGASRENATVLRDLLQRTSDEIFEIPLEEGSSEQQQRTGTD